MIKTIVIAACIVAPGVFVGWLVSEDSVCALWTMAIYFFVLLCAVVNAIRKGKI